MAADDAFFDLGGPTSLDVLTHTPLPRVAVKALGEGIRWRMDPGRHRVEHWERVQHRAKVAIGRLAGVGADDVTLPADLTAEAIGLPDGARVLHPPACSERLEALLRQWRARGHETAALRTDEGDGDGASILQHLQGRQDSWVALDWIRPGDGVARDLAAAVAANPDLHFLIEASDGLGRLVFPLAASTRWITVVRSGGALLSGPGVGVRISAREHPRDDEPPADLLLAALTASAGLIDEVGLNTIAANISDHQATLLPRLHDLGLAPTGTLEPSAPRPNLHLLRIDGESVEPLIDRLRRAGVACGLKGESLRVALHIHNRRDHVDNFVCALRGETS